MQVERIAVTGCIRVPVYFRLQPLEHFFLICLLASYLPADVLLQATFGVCIAVLLRTSSSLVWLLHRPSHWLYFLLEQGLLASRNDHHLLRGGSLVLMVGFRSVSWLFCLVSKLDSKCFGQLCTALSALQSGCEIVLGTL